MIEFDTGMLLVSVVVVVVIFFILRKKGVPVLQPPDVSLDSTDPVNWEIGPVDYPGGNPSTGVPLHPVRHPKGLAIPLPYPNEAAGSANYVTLLCSLRGSTKITLEYEVELPSGVTLLPCKFPDRKAAITLFFQRSGDQYTQKYEAYRWYAAFGKHQPIRSNGSLEARSSDNWTAVLSSSAQKNLDLFQTAWNNSVRVGFVLGGGDGLGHGIYATGPGALLIIKRFAVA